MLVLMIVSVSDLSCDILMISSYYLKRKLNSGLVEIVLAYRVWAHLPQVAEEEVGADLSSLGERQQNINRFRGCN